MLLPSSSNRSVDERAQEWSLDEDVGILLVGTEGSVDGVFVGRAMALQEGTSKRNTSHV